MSDIALDSSGDLDFTGAELSLLVDAEAIAQEIRIGLKMFKGEWFMDTRVGMPYMTDIFVKAPKLNVLQSIFVRAIESVPGVRSVDRCTVTLDTPTRTLLVSFTATSDTGAALEFEEAFVLP